MTRRYFGTDGMRGAANRHPITPAVFLNLAMAASRYFRRTGHQSRVIIGKDTRLSGYLLETALTSGFISMGMEVFLLGPMPTPAVAMLTRSMRCDLGVMISASHNPYPDNGVKLFGPTGHKLSDIEEQEIERLMDVPPEDTARSEDLGRAQRVDDAPGRYIEFVKRTFPAGRTLEGLKVVVDCANGAAYRIAPEVFYELGAEVIRLGVNPTGLRQGADIGIALDGDADRLIVCDENGHVVDGDQVMALIAGSHAEKGLLRGPLVCTVMSNLGLERYLSSRGIGLVRAPVGDRYVMQAMRVSGSNLGGEQSGHIILADHATTGDGIAAALQVLAVMVERKLLMSQLAQSFTPVPQLLRNVHTGAAGKAALLASPAVAAAIRAGEKRLAAAGTLLIRPSGTEPLVRVMAQGDNPALLESIVSDICSALEAASRA